jgi:glucose-1-phosphate thymidylyltransferase
MKAIILCAGLGTRLRPLTFSTAKHLIPVANKPVLYFGLESIAAVGVKQVGMIVSKESRPLIAAAVEDGRRWQIQVEYIEQPEPRGLAHAAQCAESFVDGDPFIMYLGDNLIPEGLAGAVRQFRAGSVDAVVMLKSVPDPRRFGVAVVEGERIVRLVEKPKDPVSDLAVVGGYVFTQQVFESIRRIKPSWRNEYEITDAIQDLIDRGLPVAPYVVRGWWKDAGQPDDILDANRVMLDQLQPAMRGSVDSASNIEGLVRIEEGAEVIRTRIHGPAVVGAGARLVDADIGPYASIGDAAQVISSRVEDSVIMEKSVLENVSAPVKRSLLGRQVRVGKGSAEGKSIHLLLGDQCEVDL